MQFSYSRPIIAKTRADGWVVIVANGYDTVSGKGKIYMINPKTGALIRTLTTTAADPGAPASPSGLAQISGFTEDFHNQIVEQIYGGDLNGNVWRWDVSDPHPANWKTVLFAQLTAPTRRSVDGDSAARDHRAADRDRPQQRQRPLGVRRHGAPARQFGPALAVARRDRAVDVPEQIQTFYAIRDGTLTTPLVAGLADPAARDALRVANALTTGAARRRRAERLVHGPSVRATRRRRSGGRSQRRAFVATATQPDPCLTSLPAYIYAREYTTAESDIQVGGVTVNAAYSDQGAVGLSSWRC